MMYEQYPVWVDIWGDLSDFYDGTWTDMNGNYSIDVPPYEYYWIQACVDDSEENCTPSIDFSSGLPDYKKLAKYEPSVSSRVYGDAGELIAEYAIQKRLFIPIESIPDVVINSFLSAEDKNFFLHYEVGASEKFRVLPVAHLVFPEKLCNFHFNLCVLGAYPRHYPAALLRREDVCHESHFSIFFTLFAIALARSGGTAFPICLNWLPLDP